ncbi:hypothetical protein D8674_012084 [Pyrus ussuriensis x Pyrus communis]|uniref:PSP proline-rich domain-containing protein n=1 Tax=Pyrus ussuriensis x Pyrus communis TaxID=2448454 RepID=A0A5N5G0L6_9ROSA|nr:hypothetical protein D8674_012084 [Pyrus ussuriensis x Pyrus communis]
MESENFIGRLAKRARMWSPWHTKHVSSSQDPIEAVESGEETFFPVLRVGIEKASAHAVSFWMDNQTRKADHNEPNVPLYDRGYAIGLTLAGDGSSNLEGGLEADHSFKKCPKRRNNAAVNSARKQLKSKRNQNAGSCNPTRYYQKSSAAGKYDSLRPGVLDAETQKLLGLGELDPPPWLNRMREIDYPPG